MPFNNLLPNATTGLPAIPQCLSCDGVLPTLPTTHFQPWVDGRFIGARIHRTHSQPHRQCIGILGFLSTKHDDALSPHVFKMISVGDYVTIVFLPIESVG
ncbi:hypothetical protein Hanom_Chr06g00492661 [Helianthus anomalus]